VLRAKPAPSKVEGSDERRATSDVIFLLLERVLRFILLVFSV
jgi:hypothetical protein